jgi:hypothetical protein
MSEIAGCLEWYVNSTAVQNGRKALIFQFVEKCLHELIVSCFGAVLLLLPALFFFVFGLARPPRSLCLRASSSNMHYFNKLSDSAY